MVDSASNIKCAACVTSGLCGGCGKWSCSCTSVATTTIRFVPASTTPQGWQCPVCRKVWAPFVMECSSCNNGAEVIFDPCPVDFPNDYTVTSTTGVGTGG